MRMTRAILWTSLALTASSLGGCGGGTGACVGTGGVLSSPVCKPDWSEAECSDWDSQGVNGATWAFYDGDACPDLGYTERCSDGSYRRPGAC
jgi:hypothetical protein